MLKKLNRWEDFSSADLHIYGVKLQAYRNQLEEFCTHLDESRSRISETVRLYEFFDKVRSEMLEQPSRRSWGCYGELGGWGGCRTDLDWTQ